jgi:hypothetical protein
MRGEQGSLFPACLSGTVGSPPKRGKEIPQNFLKPRLKLLAILGKEKETFRLTTCRIEKAKKDMIEQQT